MPIRIKKYTAADFIEQTWRNGAGTTKELARDSKDAYRWRLSRAKLTHSRPFSPFPGYDRVLVTLGYPSIWILHSGGKKRMLPALSPYTFSGDVETTVEIQEPTEDFNLFILRNEATGKIYPTYFGASKEMQLPIAGQEHFVYCLEGRITLQEPNTVTSTDIQKGELFRLSREDQKEYLNLKAVASSPETIALWIVVHLKS